MSSDEGSQQPPPRTPSGDAAAGAPAGDSPRRRPDFFIVGQPKCGTTALYEMLRRHPQIYMPECKEPWFFADELYVRAPPRPEITPQNLDEYLSLFELAKPEQRVGEATALYFWSHSAARRIAEVQPDARIIVILREPASLLRSLHLQFVQTYIEAEPDLRKAIALEQPRREGREVPRHTYWPEALSYSEHAAYVEQLRRYYDLFAPDQILVLIYDDFRDDNEETVRRVLRFLDVDDTAAVDTLHANPTLRARSQRMLELVHAISVGRGPVSLALKSAIKMLTPTGLRRRALEATKSRLIFAEPAPPDEELMLELHRRFRGEVEALSEFVGRDLVSLWGYDAIAPVLGHTPAGANDR